MKLMNIKDLQDGHLLGRDLYRDNTLILKAGTPLTKNVISKLRQWGFTTIEVRDDLNSNDEEIIYSNNKNNESSNNISKLKKLFFENLTTIGHEHRYGRALHNANDYFWLENIFVNHMSNPTVYTLLEKLKKWDLYTYQHSFDVFILGTLFAKKIKLNNIESFSLGCLLHDIGKIEIPKSILKKPAKLSIEEFNLIKCHTLYGYKILKQNNFPEEICKLAKYHHERIDGSGYPNGLTSDEIDEEYKILGLIDVYSALTLPRPYRNAFGSQVAETILIKECRMVDKNYYYKLFNMLEIFPLNSTVELTNGKLAKIIQVNNSAPSFPILIDAKNQSRQITMPLNKSVKINKILNV